jgi:hypothetical protein
MCDYSEYERVLKFQNLMMDFELSFKSNKTYQTILEHTDIFNGIEYLDCIKNEFGNIYSNNKDFLIELCVKNDKYGKSIKSNIPSFTSCSPSNLRYIYHSLLILTNIKNNKLYDTDIVEIGGGYGGLCFFIHNLAKIFNITIKSYSIFDIKEASILQKRYLKLLDLDVNTYHINDKWELHKNSYLISNYAFSEIPRILQEEYTSKILNNYINHGFLVWNFIPVYNFIKDKRLHIEDERPNDGRKFVYVYPT